MDAVKALILLDFWELTNNLQPYLYLWKTGSE